MKLACPLCGARDIREFHYQGAASLADRPDPDAPEAAREFLDYVYMRDNPAGENRELWFHAHGCGAWLVATRDVTTHEFLSVRLATDKEPTT